MSDGSNFDDDECQQQLDVLKNKYPGLKFHAVFFGEDTGQEKLKGMALQFTRGKFHLSKNAPELLDTFKKIAAEITNFRLGEQQRMHGSMTVPCIGQIINQAPTFEHATVIVSRLR